MDIQFTTQIFEGRPDLRRAYPGTRRVLLWWNVGAGNPESERSGQTLLFEEAERMGSLEQILEEAGHLKSKSKLEGPQFIRTQRISLPLCAEQG